MITIRLMGREYCHLCQKMKEIVEPLAQQRGFYLQWIDIDDDDQLEETYGTLVPVLVGEQDELICFYHFNAKAVDDYLGKMR